MGARIAASGVLCALLAGAFAGTASAKTVELTKYSGSSFDGSGSVGGPAPFPSGLHDIAVNRATGHVFVANQGASRIYKFSSAGTPEAFSGLGGSTTITQPVDNFGDLFVDDSSGATGRIFSFPEGGPVRAYEPSGVMAPGFPAERAPCAGDVAPDGTLWLAQGEKIEEYDPVTGLPTGVSFKTPFTCDVAIDSQGNFYGVENNGSWVRKYNSTGVFVDLLDQSGIPEPEIAVDRTTDHVFIDHGGYVLEFDKTGAFISKFGLAEGAYPGLINSQGIAASNKIVYVANERFGSPPRVDVFGPSAPITVPTVTTSPPTIEPTTAVLRGVVNGDGVDTTDCEFEWGTVNQDTRISVPDYNHVVPCAEGKVFTGASGDHAVTLAIAGLTKGTPYHYRLTAKNANNVMSYGADFEFRPSSRPLITPEVSTINTDGARIDATIDPNGGLTSYRVEWGTEAGVYGHTVPVPDGVLETTLKAETFRHILSDLSPGTVYHYQVTATNDAGTTTTGDRAFKTYLADPTSDPCSNAHVRQQTGAALLLDCRAYELVSARDAGGYDVESSLIVDQTPLSTSPDAPGRVLYSVHRGVIPGVSGNPTNFGPDPYVATRDGVNHRWTTTYVGLPADGMPSTGAFGSPLMGMDGSLSEFAFGGETICDPCFSDGSINVPLRLRDGQLVKGMAGSMNPAGDPAGSIGQAISSDGSHLVFGSEARFELSGNSNGDVTIYDRNLVTGLTQVVSTNPDGSTMSGTGNGELGISSNGNRIAVGQKLGSDAEGNAYWHPYMHIGLNSHSVDLAPGTSGGVLFDGMTNDGSKVFYTSTDQLLPEDEDTSADVYEVDLDASGNRTMKLLSVASTGAGSLGDPGNTDSCSPVTQWNSPDGSSDCDVVALAGGAGLASGNGTFYFLSPERLDISDPENLPVDDQANLYVVRPGEPTHFVATIDDSNAKPPPEPASHPLLRSGFATGFANAAATAIDESDGSVYVFDISTKKVSKYDASGAAVTSFGDTSPSHDGHLSGSTTPAGSFITGSAFGLNLPAQIAVDNDSTSPSYRDLYVPDLLNGVVDKFDSSGQYVSQFSLGGDFPVGVAVDPSTGRVYVPGYSGSTYVFDSTGAPVTTLPIGATAVAVAPGGDIYATGAAFAGSGPTKVYNSAGAFQKTLDSKASKNVAIDAQNGDVYVNEGNQIEWFDSTGSSRGAFAVNAIGTSSGLSVNSSTKYVFLTTGPDQSNDKVAEYGYFVPPYQPIDNQAIVHGVEQAAVHDFSDFQVTPDGRFAAFTSRLPLTGADLLLHAEVYRYDAQDDALDCASCTPTRAVASRDASMSPTGINLANDGTVFFTSGDPLVLRDSNEQQDAYEWSDGFTQLISTGSSRSDSGILSVSRDGTDVYFFTRQTLVPEDRNGAHMKIYDARAGGGFAFVPAQMPCAAADECHGPGTRAPEPLTINTVTGAGEHGQGQRLRPCRRGFVKRRGRCVTRHRTHRKRGRGGKSNRG